VVQPDGSRKKVRDCRIGDTVRTLLGHRRIVAIWANDPARPQLDQEVCCVGGVWITAGHPVISGGRWVNPCELAATAPWRKRRHVMSDMFTFELEGHDDTILLSGGEDEPLLVSCTLGKDLGEGFRRDIWTRRSTRCAGSCAQCDAVFIPGVRFDAGMDPSLRSSTFSAFPQVEWEGADVSEFELAERLAAVNGQVPKQSHNDVVLAALDCTEGVARTARMAAAEAA